MNYRIIGTYFITLSFFGFLIFAYFNYSKNQDRKYAEIQKMSTSTLSKADVEELVKEAIKANPKLIMDSVEQYQLQQIKDAEAALQQKVVSKLADIQGNPNDPKVGPSTATIKIVDFFDYNCGFCKRMALTKSKILESNTDIQYIFKELPIFGESSILAAKAGLAINEMDATKYLPFHVALLNFNGPKTEENITRIVGQIGVDPVKFAQLLKDEKWNGIITDNQKLAKELGINGTPTLIVGNEVVRGMLQYQELQNKILTLKGLKTDSTETIKSTVQPSCPASEAANAVQEDNSTSGSTSGNEQVANQPAANTVTSTTDTNGPVSCGCGNTVSKESQHSKNVGDCGCKKKVTGVDTPDIATSSKASSKEHSYETTTGQPCKKCKGGHKHKGAPEDTHKQH
ncbi:DsbA family protein [Rickettsiales endosymbiont of Peranema trichophorum]|uniref:DsbA family protein n=1 Tax=Rickettsiales endosymbiont of Peranema trichophorum TaxID=2486577 RepID=UPI0010231790|nr:DsbA family protein [Rickettsiales endosymbiont of Peranema trichophorum]RZI47421.1 DsbA family protein [Rickettsiales endosymbiont of Peranema trichophorum]